MLDEDSPKVYGLDTINTAETVYVTEGPFDSNFIGNAIAMCGSDVNLGSFDYKFVFVFDNAPGPGRSSLRYLSHRDRTQGCDLSLKY